MTRTLASAARLYYENAHSDHDREEQNTTHMGIAVFPQDFQSIRPFAERANTNIMRWTKMERGNVAPISPRSMRQTSSPASCASSFAPCAEDRTGQP